MDLLIGVDEAGYGPNYGPLAVAATAWRIEKAGGWRPEAGGRSGQGSGSKDQGSRSPTPARAGASPPPAIDRNADLYKLLRKAVCRAPDKAGRKVAIADSKVLYSPQVGLRQLERGVLAALAVMGAKPQAAVARVGELLAATGADPERRRHELACHADDELALPLEALADEVAKLAARLDDVCRESCVTLVAMRARLVYPAEFNALVERWGSKGAALSHVTMGLVRSVVDEMTVGRGYSTAKPQAAGTTPEDGPASVRIFFDKHGGRSRYAALVQHHFAESWIETIAEERRSSRYRWVHGETPVEAEFRVGCEELLPTALASMTAKYHREVAMRAFNAFWTSRVPGLRPTAGYPRDAARFRTEIAAVQAELGIADAVLWRRR